MIKRLGGGALLMRRGRGFLPALVLLAAGISTIFVGFPSRARTEVPLEEKQLSAKDRAEVFDNV